MRVCTGGVHALSPGVSSCSRGLVSRISNSPRYEQQLTEISCRVDRNPSDSRPADFVVFESG